MEILYLMIGIAIGITGTYVAYSLYVRGHYQAGNHDLRYLKEQNQKMDVENQLFRKNQEKMEVELADTHYQLNRERERVVSLSKENARMESDLRNLRQKMEEQKNDLAGLQEKFSIQFTNLANEIFEENSKKFTSQNQHNIKELLNPLKDKLTDFEKKVEQNTLDSAKGHAALREQIAGLRELNQQITREAENLTRALKGDNKTQGNWGEFILESILEKSGLQRGREYMVQESVNTGNGKRLQPDVIVRLPENKNIIIDSKVSLVAYEKWVNTQDEDDRAMHIRNHILSLRNHIKGLSEKDYQNLYGVKSLDFVLLFMPVEPAFSLAVQHDDQLFNNAYDKNIVIVCPSTLIATLRTIASIWRQEHQNNNAVEIARQGGLLYDKFRAFTEDLIKVGESLHTTKKKYDLAMNKLSDGKDNLIRKTERLRELGANVSKPIDQQLIDRSK